MVSVVEGGELSTSDSGITSEKLERVCCKGGCACTVVGVEVCVG